MGINCDRSIDVTHWTGTQQQTRVAYDNSTWPAMNTGYINSTKETSSIHRMTDRQILEGWRPVNHERPSGLNKMHSYHKKKIWFQTEYNIPPKRIGEICGQWSWKLNEPGRQTKPDGRERPAMTCKRTQTVASTWKCTRMIGQGVQYSEK